MMGIRIVGSQTADRGECQTLGKAKEGPFDNTCKEHRSLPPRFSTCLLPSSFTAYQLHYRRLAQSRRPHYLSQIPFFSPFNSSALRSLTPIHSPLFTPSFSRKTSYQPSASPPQDCDKPIWRTRRTLERFSTAVSVS